ncbi:MAG: DUF2784 domain-containing protein [Patescibacteria group bacterium]
MIYRLLDIFFLIFHTSLIIFCIFGWIWKKTRIANIIALLVTAGSWLILGLIVKSPGYCPLTDWHFNVLNKLGINNLPNSYIKYLADRLMGSDLNAGLVDSVTLWGLVVALILSARFNIEDFRLRRRRNNRG